MILSWIAFVLCGLISRFILLVDFDQNACELISIFFIVFISFFVIIDIVRRYKFKQECTIVSIGYLFRLFLLFWDYYCKKIFALPHSGSDSEMFHAVAYRKANDISTRDYGASYTNMLSIIYRVFNDQRLIGQFFNVLLSMTAIYFFYKTLKLIISEKRYIILGLMLISLSPNYAILSSILLRESIMSCLISISLYYFVLWWFKSSKYSFFFSIILCLYAATFHSGAIAPAVGYIICWVLYDKKNNIFNFRFKTIFSVIFVLFLFMFINQRYGDSLFGRFQIEKSIEEITGTQSSGRGSSGYRIGISTGVTVLDMLINTPLRTVYFIMSPMPWDWRGITDIITFVLSSCFYFVGYIYVIKVLKNKSIIKSKNENLMIAMLLVMIAGCSIFAWGVSNAGTAMRHRDKFIAPYILMWILAVQSLYVNRDKKENVY